MPILPALGKLRPEKDPFKASLGYIVRLCLKNKEIKKKPNLQLSLTSSHVMICVKSKKKRDEI